MAEPNVGDLDLESDAGEPGAFIPDDHILVRVDRVLNCGSQDLI